MINKATTLKLTLTAFFTAITALLGWFGWLVILLVICMLIDYFTGSQVALRNGEWSSRAARDGRLGKIITCISVITSGITDIVLGIIVNNIPSIKLPFKYSVLLCPAVVLWYIFTEIGSIIENIGRLGVAVPPFLSSAIKILKTQIDQIDEQNNTKIL